MDVGLIIIGNEILSGATQDTNSTFMARSLFEMGADLKEIVTLPDIIPLVASKVKEYSERFDLVLTSGGIGPTHDDITYEAVAQGLGVGLHLEPHFEALVKSRFKKRINEASLKLARIPQGSTWLDPGPFWFPPVVAGNVVIFPGVPLLLEGQFPALAQLLPEARHFVRSVRVFYSEFLLADLASDVDARYADVEVGSYPHLTGTERHVTLKFTGKKEESVESAFRDFVAGIPAEARYELLD